MADVVFLVPDGEEHREFARIDMGLLGGTVPRIGEEVLLNEASNGLPHGQWLVTDVQWWIDQFSFTYRKLPVEGAKTVVRIYLRDL